MYSEWTSFPCAAAEKVKEVQMADSKYPMVIKLRLFLVMCTIFGFFATFIYFSLVAWSWFFSLFGAHQVSCSFLIFSLVSPVESTPLQVRSESHFGGLLHKKLAVHALRSSHK